MTLEILARRERGRLLAALVVRLGDVARAEEALQEAFAAAVTAWADRPPERPEAWLLRVALNRAIDRHRAEARAAAGQAALAPFLREETEEAMAIPDERLRLIFACCHPALAEKSRVALTLRVVAGLSTGQIAAAFLDDEATMGQRLSRAKAKIAAAGIPFAVPGPEHWGGRLQAVLKVVYLIYTTAYTQGPTDAARELAGEALFLARLLDRLRPGEAEVEGALALILLTEARAGARSPEGVTVPPSEQDRALWDAAMIAEGKALLAQAVARGAPGPFQIKAAIAALHATDAPTDWAEVAALYGALYRHEPTPVVALNAAVARAEAGHAAEALTLIEAMAPVLSGFQPYHAARADVLVRLGRRAEAIEAYDRAIAGAGPGDARLLAARRARLLA